MLALRMGASRSSTTIRAGAGALALMVLAALALSPLLDASAASDHAATTPALVTYVKYGKNLSATIWLANADGSHAVKLASKADQPEIAPNGSAVAYAGEGATNSDSSTLQLIPASGGTSRRLATSVRDPGQTTWSPDSTMIASVVGPELKPNRLIVVNVATGAVTTVAHAYIEGVSWSPDSTHLVYASTGSTNTFPYKSDLHIVAATGGAATTLTHDHSSVDPVWGPKTIVFTRFKLPAPKNDNPKDNLFTINPDGSGEHQLTHGTAPKFLSGLSPIAFSDDGSHLLGEYGGQDTSYAQTVNPVTGAQHTLGGHTNDYIGLAISHDGSTVLAAKGGYTRTSRTSSSPSRMPAARRR
jgi:WD40 repeat protein